LFCRLLASVAARSGALLSVNIRRLRRFPQIETKPTEGHESARIFVICGWNNSQ